jgi:hypothetical protein
MVQERVNMEIVDLCWVNDSFYRIVSEGING